MEYIKIDRLLMCVLLCLHCSSQKITTSKISSNLNVEESNQCWGTSEYFKCDNEECIYKSLKCNGLQECGDGSDETFELCNRTSVSCEIPNDKEYYTNDGSWKPILKPGTKISVNSQVIERCNPTLDGESEFNSMTCMQNGTWKVDLKNEYCTEMCTPLYSKTLDLICNHQDTFVNCSEWSNPGTVLKISCKPNYRLPRGLTNAPFEKIVCQTDGRWSEKLYYCDPVPIRQRANCSSNQHRCDDGECVDLEFTCDGVKDCNDGSDETLKLCRIQRNPCMIPNSDVGFFTHHLDDGTLVPPGTLVRIYTGVYEKCKLDDQYTYGNYWVCLPSGHWEKYTRRQYCINICPPLTSEGLNITCTYRGRKADCSKWSKPGTILKHSCKQKYALPKGVTQSSDNVVCKPNGLWSDLLPNCYSVSALQNSDDRLDNIDNNMCDGSDLKFQCKNGECISKEYKCDGIPDCSDGSDEHPYLCKNNKMKPCRIPHTHNRFYVVNSLNERVYIPSGTTVRHGYTVRKKCSPDFDDARFDSTMSCSETNWFLKTDYEFCSETCAPKTSESLDLECTFRGNKTDCSKWSKIGTVMKIACKPNYSEHTGETNLPKQLICQSNGQWSGKLYECNRDGCPPINIKSLDLNCSLYGNPANCSKWSSFGTSLRSTCKPNFRPYEDLSENPVEIYCLDSGLWSETLNGCQPVLIFGDQELDPGSLANSSGTTCTIPYSEEFNHVYDNNGSYILTSGTRVQLGSLIKQSCKPGYYQTTEYGKLMHCLGKEKWYEQSGGKLCLKKCSPMTSDSLELTCTFRGEKTDCSTFSNPGTKLKPNCLPHYSIPNGQPVTPVDLLCLNNGQWSGQLYNCTPDCGKMYENKSLLISHGDVSKFGRAPWHIGLYEMNNNSAYDLVCGGSLLSSNLVVTAAHCFESVFKTQSVIENGNKYKIGISKYNIDINYHDNNYTQIIEFRTVYLSENYRGAAWSYHNDIAVIVLSKKVTINAVVMPICIDWEMKYSVQNGSPGTVVGWGATEKGVQSPVLLEATLAFIDQKECQSLFPQYTMIDKFCAGAGSGASVEPGDSGGGLTFEHSGLQYLTGIVSLKLPSNTSTALFTEVRYHLQWLRNVYVKHSK